MNSLRILLNAEMAFQNAAGKGEFGEPKALYDAGLIDKDLANGVKDGFRFTVVTKKSTMSSQPAIDLIARPIEHGRGGRRSFYLTESGVLMTSEEKDATLASMRPFATGDATPTPVEDKSESITDDESSLESIANEVSTNEAAVMATLIAINTAEAKYITKFGGGNYGTLEQLEKAELIDKSKSSSAQHGYLFELKISATRPASSAMFGISATPQTYGLSGRSSFFIDQSGVLRGTDKEGGTADATDPAIK